LVLVIFCQGIHQENVFYLHASWLSGIRSEVVLTSTLQTLIISHTVECHTLKMKYFIHSYIVNLVISTVCSCCDLPCHMLTSSGPTCR
jgi:hypothetical protein